MDSKKYIGMDVHKESISIAVRNDVGKIVMECVIETKANIILDFIHGLRGGLHVTFEEGTWAAWMYDLLKPHVTNSVVCDPRKNASMREGNQSDKIDARQLAELAAPMNHLSPVYHGEHGLRSLKGTGAQLSDHHQGSRTGHVASEGDLSQLGHSPVPVSRSMHPRHRVEWLGKISEAGVRMRRAEFYYQTTGCTESIAAKRCGRICSPRVAETPSLETALPEIPSIGPIRAAVLLGVLQTPHRFPNQAAAAMDVQRIGHRDTKQRRSP